MKNALNVRARNGQRSAIANIATNHFDALRASFRKSTGEMIGMIKGFSFITVVNPSETETGSYKTLVSA